MRKLSLLSLMTVLAMLAAFVACQGPVPTAPSSPESPGETAPALVKPTLDDPLWTALQDSLYVTDPAVISEMQAKTKAYLDNPPPNAEQAYHWSDLSQEQKDYYVQCATKPFMVYSVTFGTTPDKYQATVKGMLAGQRLTDMVAEESILATVPLSNTAGDSYFQGISYNPTATEESEMLYVGDFMMTPLLPYPFMTDAVKTKLLETDLDLAKTTVRCVNLLNNLNMQCLLFDDQTQQYFLPTNQKLDDAELLSLADIGAQSQAALDAGQIFDEDGNWILYTGKPVIYLYPTAPTDITVTLQFDGQMTYTYPAYHDGWHVTAYPGGRLINKGDQSEHYYLFWEGVSPHRWNMDTGFVVAGQDTEAFLRDKLAYMGLTPREYNDFITWWIPKMQNNAYNLIHFSSVEEYGQVARLGISPAPDSLLRIHMAWKPLAAPIDISPQTLSPFIRQGFTAVEWGGTQTA